MYFVDLSLLEAILTAEHVEKMGPIFSARVFGPRPCPNIIKANF